MKVLVLSLQGALWSSWMHTPMQLYVFWCKRSFLCLYMYMDRSKQHQWFMNIRFPPPIHLMKCVSWFCLLSVTFLEIWTTASPVKILRLLLVTFLSIGKPIITVFAIGGCCDFFFMETLSKSCSGHFFLTDTVAAHRNGRLVKLLKKSTTSQKEQSQESELWTGRGAADKVPAHKKEEPFFSYSRMWPPVLGAAIMMSMFLAWVAAKPLVVHRIRTRMSARPGRPPFKRQMSTPNVDKFQRVWLNGQFQALLPSTVELNWQLEICEQGGSGKHSM